MKNIIEDPKHKYLRLEPIPSNEEVAEFYAKEFYDANASYFNNSSLEVQQEQSDFFNARWNDVYTNSQNVVVTTNFDNSATSWFTRLTSKITLPYKIDWQTNVTYNGPEKYAQGNTLAVVGANLGFSKDIMKDKATIALNVQDVFNSRKRMYNNNIPNVLNSYVEMQWAMRQITLSFTYRFNKKKEERTKPARSSENGDDFQG